MNNNNLDQLSEQDVNEFLQMTANSPIEFEAFLRLPLEERRLQLTAILEEMTVDTDDLESFVFPEDNEPIDYDSMRYSEENMKRVEDYYTQNFGKNDHVLHEIISPDLHIDIMLTKPTKATPFYTLTTLGMGAWKMNVPDDLKDYTYSRCELMITLPSHWNMDSDGFENEENYWPVRLLKSVARLPFEYDTFVDFGHTIDNQGVYDSSTPFTNAMIMAPFKTLERPCILENGEQLTILQLIPLYPEEMNYKIKFGVDKLLELFDSTMTHVVNNKRKNYIV